MVGVFRRSLSFPTKINTSRPSKPPISQHTRSVSLPCRSHPLISQLNDEISQLRSLRQAAEFGFSFCSSAVWLLDGLNRLKDVHDSLAHVLQLSHVQESLRNRHAWVENLLEDLLRFVDAYGTFRTSVLALREQQAAAQVAIRRQDETRIALYLKSRNKIAKEISRLGSSVQRSIKRESRFNAACLSRTIIDEELTTVIEDVMEVTVSVSVVLFNCVYFWVGCKRKTSCGGALWLLNRDKKFKIDERIEEPMSTICVESLLGLRKMKGEEVRMVLRKMGELEEGILGIESGSENVFRSLVNTRVSFLNVLTN